MNYGCSLYFSEVGKKECSFGFWQCFYAVEALLKHSIKHMFVRSAYTKYIVEEDFQHLQPSTHTHSCLTPQNTGCFSETDVFLFPDQKTILLTPCISHNTTMWHTKKKTIWRRFSQSNPKELPIERLCFLCIWQGPPKSNHKFTHFYFLLWSCCLFLQDLLQYLNTVCAFEKGRSKSHSASYTVRQKSSTHTRNTEIRFACLNSGLAQLNYPLCKQMLQHLHVTLHVLQVASFVAAYETSSPHRLHIQSPEIT